MENEDINKAQWYNTKSAVVIEDSFFSTDCPIFPPSSHEDLPIVSAKKDKQLIEEQQLLHSSSSSTSLSSDGDHNGEGEEWEVENKDVSLVRSRLGCFSSGINKIVSQMMNRAVFRISMWLFASATTGVGAMVLVVVLYRSIRRAKRWQRQLQPENKQHLILLIKEKDQKINQLVLQLAQLNDMLSARKRVPVLQVA